MVEEIVGCLDRHRFVAIQGSTGMGKSTLGKLAALRFGGAWEWVSFASMDCARSVEHLQHFARRSAAPDGPKLLVLDDLNPLGTGSASVLRELAVVAHLVVSAGGRLIVTTQRLLGSPFWRQSNLPDTSEKRVKSFTRDEVQDLCEKAGCPEGHLIEDWVKIISLQTRNHPQLVHARVMVLTRKGWLTPTSKDITETPDEIVEEIQLVRQLLQDLRSDQIELLDKLSLATGPFRRDQALAIAESPPPIARPGDSFDSLVGPWIEPSSDNYFRLSTLLSGRFLANCSKETLRERRSAFGNAIYNAGDLSMIEASEVLLQSIHAGDSKLATKILGPLTLTSRPRPADWDRCFLWLLALPANEPIFPNDLMASSMLRLGQFRLAIAFGHSSAPSFALALYNELMAIPPSEGVAEWQGYAAFEIILAMRVLVAPDLLLRCFLYLAELAKSNFALEKVARMVEARPGRARAGTGNRDFETTIFGFILCRRGRRDYLVGFINAVDALSPDQQSLILTRMSADVFGLLRFVDQAWLDEVGEEKPDWDGAIEVLESVKKAGERWAVGCLAGVAVRGIATIQDEYLGCKESALKALIDGQKRWVSASLVLRYQHGMVHFHHKEYRQAYEIWSEVLEDWPKGPEQDALSSLLAFSNCGSAAGFTGRWEEAADIFNRGAALARDLGRNLDATSFQVDAAYAFWRADRRADAIEGFAEGLRSLELMAGKNKTAEFNVRWALTGYLIKWCSDDARMRAKPAAIPPPPGFCSEARDKEKYAVISGEPRVQAGIIWFMLATAEVHAGLPGNAFSALEEPADQSLDPRLGALVELLRVQKALLDHDFESIPVLAERLSLATERAQTVDDATKNGFRSPGAAGLDRTEGGLNSIRAVEYCFASALVFTSEQSFEGSTAIKKWESQALKASCPAVAAVLVRMASLYAMSPDHAWRTYLDPNASWFESTVAAICMAANPESTPAIAHAGLVVLVTDVSGDLAWPGCSDAIGRLTRKVWLRQLPKRFNLLAPRLTVPAILDACGSNLNGLALASRILLAANEAVSVKVSTKMLDRLRALSWGVLD